jgi:hypothetical protein
MNIFSPHLFYRNMFGFDHDRLKEKKQQPTSTRATVCRRR